MRSSAISFSLFTQMSPTHVNHHFFGHRSPLIKGRSRQEGSTSVIRSPFGDNACQVKFGSGRLIKSVRSSSGYRLQGIRRNLPL